MRAYLVIFAALIGAPASAAPAELPPETYSATSYVDSEGCAFARAELGGQVTWVARLDANRQPVCGKTPSLARPLKVEHAVAVSYAPRRTQPKSAAQGFRPAWDDGRLNPHRGPRSAAGDDAMRRIWTDDVPMERR
jgi:hypothetical protein